MRAVARMPRTTRALPASGGFPLRDFATAGAGDEPFGAIEGARTAHLYRHGIGPSLDGLFAQSGFGIVTAAGFGLMRAWERPAAFTLRLNREARLSDLVDRFAALRAATLTLRLKTIRSNIYFYFFFPFNLFPF